MVPPAYNNPLTRLYKPERLRSIRLRFAKYDLGGRCEDLLLSLFWFADVRPFTFWTESCLDASLSHLEQDVDLTFRALRDEAGRLDHAVLSFYRQPEAVDDAEEASVGSPAGISAIEYRWHPDYQRLAEHVYNHLINVHLRIAGKRDKKDYVSMALANRHTKLDALGLSPLQQGFSTTVRNAISHGGVSYSDFSIVYSSTNKAEELYGSQLQRLRDSLFDCCSSQLCAVLLFLIRNWERALLFGLHRLPPCVAYLLTRAFHQHRQFSSTA